MDPIACSLGAGDLEARLKAVRGLGRSALTRRERVGNGHRLRFRSEPGTRERLEEIVSAERACCPFLTLSLEEQDGEIVLTIAAPAGGEATAAALAAAFGAEAGPGS
jgi:hypothetical protein